MVTITNKEQMQKYYVKDESEVVGTYVFEDDVEFLCNIDVKANIYAYNIDARNIKAENIYAFDIGAWNIKTRNIEARNINAANIDALDIKANDISYYAVCLAHNNIECNSIAGRRENSKHFVLDGKLVVRGDL